MLRRSRAGHKGAAITLDKRLPVASGIGGGSADAAAALRLLTSLWSIDPQHAEAVAPKLGSDVPACLLSMPVRGEGAGDELSPVDLAEIVRDAGTADQPARAAFDRGRFAGWDGVDHGPLEDWREGRNDLEAAAIALAPQIETVLAWLGTCSRARVSSACRARARPALPCSTAKKRATRRRGGAARMVAPGDEPALGRGR